MRFLSTTNHNRSQGFTLIEMLVIAPLVIITISGFVALMVSMVGDVLVTRDQNNLTYEAQDSLDRIEQDARLSVQFLNTTEALPSPQGLNDGTGAFTNTQNTLILSSVATDENPRSDSRWLIYYANQPYPCGDQETYNRIFLIKVIYYIKNNALWRRVVVPDWNNNSPADAQTICASAPYTPWQQNTCSPGYTASRCQTEDMKVMDNVQSLDVKYYSDPNSSTEIPKEQATTATTIDVTVNGSKTTAGRPITSSASVRATKINNITAEATPLNAPTVTHTQPSDRPDRAVFSWNDLALASAYNVSYSINGGSWTNTTLDENATSYTVTAWRGATISFKITASNSTYTSSETTDIITLPLWTSISSPSGWVEYASTFASPAFTRTKDGVVVLKGLIKDGTATWDTPIFTLPEGYRPDERLIFYVGSYNAGSGYGRIDVLPNGEVRFMQGTATWISLDSIKFVADDSWTNLTMQNSWINYGAGYAPLSVAVDGSGRTHVQGLVRNGPTTPTHVIIGGPIPTAMQPPKQIILPGITSGTAFASFDIKPTDVVTRSAVSTYIATNAMFYPSSATGWTNLSLQGGWVVYSSTFNTPRYKKSADDIVTVEGLIKSGTSVANGTILANLPAGFRPGKKLIFSSVANSHHARIDVATNGNITIEGGGDNVWMSLDQISFIAEQ